MTCCFIYIYIMRWSQLTWWADITNEQENEIYKDIHSREIYTAVLFCTKCEGRSIQKNLTSSAEVATFCIQLPSHGAASLATWWPHGRSWSEGFSFRLDKTSGMSAEVLQKTDGSVMREACVVFAELKPFPWYNWDFRWSALRNSSSVK